MEQKPFAEADSLSDTQINYPHFMDPAGLLPTSQQLATCPCPKPDQSTPSNPTTLISILIILCHLR